MMLRFFLTIMVIVLLPVIGLFVLFVHYAEKNRGVMCASLQENTHDTTSN